jgi:uncharacterized protein YyaL (SSP411 family)
MEDPHGEFPNKNILYAAHTLEETAAKFGLAPEAAEAALDDARRRLFAARAKRPRPHLDDKVLAAWNGLMISAFSRAARALNDPRDLESARRAALFIKEKMYDAPSKTLHRRWRDGEKAVPGLSDDYVFLAQGLIDLHEASQDPAWLAWSIELMEEALRRFFDAERGGFFMASADGEKLPVRARDEGDGVEPSAGSVAALALLRLAQFAGRADFRATAEKILRMSAARMEDHPTGLAQGLVAVDFALGPASQVVVGGDPAAEAFRALLARAQRRFLPRTAVMTAPPSSAPHGDPRDLSFLAAHRRGAVEGAAVAYVCVDFACRLPTSDPEEMERSLREL